MNSPGTLKFEVLRIADYYKRMLRSLLFKGGLIAFMICLLSVSCQRTETEAEQQKRTMAYVALRQYVTEGQLYLLDQSVTNASDFLKWVEDYPSSTNKFAKEIRSTCEVVWVNTNINTWLSATNGNGPSVSTIAMTAQYRFETNIRFVGATFEGLIRTNRPPDSGFIKLDLKAR